MRRYLVMVEELTADRIEELKKKYGEIYQVTLSGVVYVYRPLKRIEYKQIVGTTEQTRSFTEEQIVQKCVVHPSIDIASSKAGTVATLTELVMVASDFGVQEEPIRL